MEWADTSYPENGVRFYLSFIYAGCSLRISAKCNFKLYKVDGEFSLYLEDYQFESLKR